MRIRRSIDFQSEEELKYAEGLAEKAGLSLSNFLRKKIKLGPLAKGGPQPRTDLYCGDCWRAGKGNVEVFKDGLCRDCWHRGADGKSAAI